MARPQLERALQVWLHTAAQTGDELQAVTAAAEALSDSPWDVIETAGFIARGQLRTATEDLGLTHKLRSCKIDSKNALVQIPAGAPYPAFDRTGRQKMGAFDTPQSLALDLLKKTLAACEGTANRGLDPACGTGIFLLAMKEAGLPFIHGCELDPRAIAVARVAVPEAQIKQIDGLMQGDQVDIVVGNPPYIPPERQNPKLRQELRDRFPWLGRRFDLAVPFSAAAIERVRTGGATGLLLPSTLLSQPYAEALRRNWLTQHQIQWLSNLQDFPEVSIQIAAIVLKINRPPCPLPSGVTPQELLALKQAPLSTFLAPGDPEIVKRIRSESVELGSMCEVDTGVVSHGPLGGKERLISDSPAKDLYAYVDAKDMQAKRIRWLRYEPHTMHRPKRLSLFSSPKLLIQRLRGNGPISAWIDTEGLVAGHTLTVVRPESSQIPLEKLLQLVQSPLIDGLIRIERGNRLDLYPHDVASIPVPKAWLTDPSRSLSDAWGLRPPDVQRLKGISLQQRSPNGPKPHPPS